MSDRTSTGNPNRREFIRTGGVAAAGALAGFSILRNAYGQSADLIKVGVIGCGGRGTGAAENVLLSSPNVRLVAMADLYQDHLEKSLKTLTDPAREGGPLKGLDVPKERQFVGFDAYKKLLQTDVNYVVLATPPGFRPEHFEACVNAGKNVFCEKPVATDPVGIRRFIAAGELSKQKGLGVVAGTQRRHQQGYLELVKQLQDGRIGQITSTRVFWNGSPLWKFERKPGWSDMEWQTRNWYYFDWICGDHIVEQHVHNLDVSNWVLGAHPVKVSGVGGRAWRTEPVYGNIYDHFALDFEYANGVHMLSMCRQWPNSDPLIAEFIVGAKGEADTSGGRYLIRGEQRWRFQGQETNPYVQEHTDLIASIRAGKPLNEAQSVAEATMTAIMGRQAAYTGKVVTWDEMMASTLKLTPEKYDFGPHPFNPVPRPGNGQV